MGIFHGNEKESVLNRIKGGDLEICLTSIHTLWRCIDELNDVNWDCVFVDEAHVLKSNKTAFYTAMDRIRTRRRVGLTGAHSLFVVSLPLCVLVLCAVQHPSCRSRGGKRIFCSRPTLQERSFSELRQLSVFSTLITFPVECGDYLIFCACKCTKW